MNDQRNLILAIVLSVLVLVAFQWIWPTPEPAPQQQPAAGADSGVPGGGAPSADQAPAGGGAPRPEGTAQAPAAGGGPQQPAAASRADQGGGGGFLPTPVSAPGVSPGGLHGPERSRAVEADPRVAIDTPRLTGSLNLKGARLDDLTLRGYTRTTASDSDFITLFSPAGAPRPARTG